MSTQTRDNEASVVTDGSTVSMPEDCAFQFRINGQMIEDTGLITRSEANELWATHKQRFVVAVEQGDDAEVALWIRMFNDTNYQRTAFRIQSDECVIERGFCFVKRPLP